MSMDEHLDKVTQIIMEYESGSWLTTDRLRELLRELSSEIYFLTKYKIEAKNKWNSLRYIHTGSVASGLIIADEEVPELKMLRDIIRAAEGVKTSIVMEISILKNEQ